MDAPNTTSPLTIQVDMLPAELLLLDGCTAVRPEVERAVRRARDGQQIRLAHGLTERRADFVARLLDHARENGELRFTFLPIDYCTLCERSGGLGGRRKNKQIPLSGFDCSTSWVRIQRFASLGGCTECWQVIWPVAKVALTNVRAQLPDQLHADGAPRWKKWARRTCTACKWTGNEGQLGELRTLMGDGHYRGKCPSCGAENRPLGKTIIESSGDAYDVVPLTPSEALP